MYLYIRCWFILMCVLPPQSCCCDVELWISLTRWRSESDCYWSTEPKWAGLRKGPIMTGHLIDYILCVYSTENKAVWMKSSCGWKVRRHAEIYCKCLKVEMSSVSASTVTLTSSSRPAPMGRWLQLYSWRLGAAAGCSLWQTQLRAAVVKSYIRFRPDALQEPLQCHPGFVVSQWLTWSWQLEAEKYCRLHTETLRLLYIL